MYLKMSSARCRPFSLGLNVLHMDSLMQDCSNYIVLEMELPQYSTKCLVIALTIIIEE